MAQKWPENGLEMVRKWPGNVPVIARKWSGNGPEKGYKTPSMLGIWDLENLASRYLGI